MDWINTINRSLMTQEAEMFLLHGDIGGYPQTPMQTLPAYLTAWRRQPTINACITASESFSAMSDEDQAAAVSLGIIVVEWTIALGLQMSKTDSEVFNAWAPAASGNPFAASGGVEADFARLHAYFTAPGTKTPRGVIEYAPPAVVIMHDVELLFDSSSPLDPAGRIAMSYIHRWSARPLLTGKNMPHQIYMIASSNKGLHSSLTQGRVEVIQIALPNLEQRMEFLEALDGLDGDKVELIDGLTMNELARISGALNLLQLEDVWYQAVENDNKLSRKMVQQRKDTLISGTYGGVIEIEYPEIGFESLAGYADLKQYFTKYVYPLLHEGSTSCPKGCVLSGPPGTGKTVFASALAADLKVPRVDVRPDRIKDKYVGESNKRIAKLCEGIAALAPCVVFIDEIDKVLPTTDDNTGVSQEILGQLQTFLSEIARGQAFFVATTNYPERVPRALLRPGRFEEVIPLLPAHLDGIRHEVMSLIVERQGLPVAEGVDLQPIGDGANDYTGADLERLLITSHKHAVMNDRREITQSDLQQALDDLVSTTTYTKEMIDSAVSFCTDRSHLPAAYRDQAGQEITQKMRTGKRRIAAA